MGRVVWIGVGGGTAGMDGRGIAAGAGARGAGGGGANAGAALGAGSNATARAAGAGAAATARAAVAPAGGAPTENTVRHTEQRARTPPAGTLAGSTRNTV